MPNRFLSIKEKVKLIGDSEDGVKVIDLQSKYKVSRSTVFYNLTNKQDILSANANGLARRSRIEKNAEMITHDQKVVNFILKCQETGIPISATIVREKANELAIESGRDSLKCTWGWWQRFRVRVNIKSGKLSGERKSVDTALVEDRKNREVPRIIINWQKEFIFNCDETGLFWRQAPVKTNFISKTEHIGDKL